LIADLSAAKMLFNHVISTPDARFVTLGINGFCLNTDMPHCECMRIPVSSIPAKMMKLCNLEPLVHRGAVCVEMRKEMCGHPVHCAKSYRPFELFVNENYKL